MAVLDVGGRTVRNAIFQVYGRPGEIYYYPARQFAVRYSYQSYAAVKPIRGCGLDLPSSAKFYVWSPGAYPNFQEVADDTSWFPEYTIQPLEASTGWTTASFHTAFQSQTGTDPCIDAPAFDWSYIPGNGRNRFWWCEAGYP